MEEGHSSFTSKGSLQNFKTIHVLKAPSYRGGIMHLLSNLN